MSPSETKTANAKLAALKAWGATVNADAKKHGTGMAVLSAGESVAAPRMSTGSPALDIRLGGGWPRGAMTEIFGPNGSGKSTLAYAAIAELQRRDPNATVVLCDVESSYSGKRGDAMGIDRERLQLFRIGTAEAAFDRIKEVLELTTADGKPVVDLLILDSVASLVTSAEDEGEMGDAQVGVLARLMSKICRQFSGLAARTGTTIIFTNQIRMKIGVLYGCVSKDTPILLADGSTKPIGEIVAGRLPLSVMSMDSISGQIEPRQIVEYYDNGPAEEWLKFEIETPDGARHLTCTPNHLILTPFGERLAAHLDEGDEVMVGIQGPDSAWVSIALPIISRQAVPADPEEHRFDLQIEGNHTYLADQVVIHNSPETTPGGEALKFYSWSRVRTSRREVLKEGTKDDAKEIGQLSRVKVEKAKLDDSVGGECMVRIMRADGLDAAYDITVLGPVLGVVKKSGNALSAETKAGIVKGAGREAFIASVKANPAARDELYDAIVKAGLAGDTALVDAAEDEAEAEAIDLVLDTTAPVEEAAVA